MLESISPTTYHAIHPTFGSTCPYLVSVVLPSPYVIACAQGFCYTIKKHDKPSSPSIILDWDSYRLPLDSNILNEVYLVHKESFTNPLPAGREWTENVSYGDFF